MKQALYFSKANDDAVICHLCPHQCWIQNGRRSLCGVRYNRDGILCSLVYGKPCAVDIDQIEKKPLYHFLPGTATFSIGTAGCNLRCLYCQNWEISRARPEDVNSYEMNSQKVVEWAIKAGCMSLSFTYNEPTMDYEYALETSLVAHECKLLTTMVTNGYIKREPLRELYRSIDAANVDLKGFSESFYERMCGGSLRPVLDTLVTIREMGVWLEITNLLVPGYNDDPVEIRKMCGWIVGNLGPLTPLHFSTFFPNFKLMDTAATPLETLQRAERIAREEGLIYVYLGNVGKRSETACPGCGRVIIERDIYGVRIQNLSRGACECGNAIPGIWR